MWEGGTGCLPEGFCLNASNMDPLNVTEFSMVSFGFVIRQKASKGRVVLDFTLRITIELLQEIDGE